MRGRHARKTKTKRNVLIALALAAVITVGATVPFSVRFSQNTSNAATQPVALGEYSGATNLTTANWVNANIAPLTYVTEYQAGDSWTTITQSWPYYAWQGTPYIVDYGIPMLPGTYSANSNPSVVNGSCYGLTQGAAGDFNLYWITVAQQMVKYGQGSSLIRLGWEMNGGWFPWAASGCPTAFVTYFQNIVTAMRTVPGFDGKFVWNPTLGNQYDNPQDMSNYYPGNSYVDYIGVDDYDTTWGSSYPGGAQNFANQESESQGLTYYANFAATEGKPLVFPEWGLGWGTCSASGQPITQSGQGQMCGGDDATWINLTYNWFVANHVVFAGYWDFGNNPPTSAIGNGNNPLTTAALQADFGGTAPPPPTTTTTVPPTTSTTTTVPPTSTTTTTVPVTSTTTTTVPPTTTTTQPPPTTTTTTRPPTTTTTQPPWHRRHPHPPPPRHHSRSRR